MAEEVKDLDSMKELTAGEMLREARTTGRRKREIQTISKQLCIREEFLQALEDGDYSVLPETVYVLGFARNYAMELGLDPNVIVEKIKKELGILPLEMPTAHVAIAEKSEPAVKKASVGERLKKVKDSGTILFIKKHWKWFVIGLATLCVLIVLVFGVRALVKHSRARAVATADVATNMVGEPAYKQNVRERFGTDNRATAEVIFQANADKETCWVKVEDARGKTIFNRVLISGDVYYVPKSSKNKATFGKAGCVDVWVRGELIPKFDEKNITNVSLDADTLLGKKKN